MNSQPPVKVSLEPFSPTVEEAYRTLLPAHDDRVAAGQLTWKLKDNPAGSGLVAIARIDDQIAGLNAFMSVPLSVHEKDLSGHQSMDTIVSPSARGRGVFSKMVQCFYEESGSQFLYGFPNSQSAPAFFGKLGWARYGQVPMLVKPIRPGFITRRIFGSQFGGNSRTTPKSVDADPIRVIPPVVGDASADLFRGSSVGIRRTVEYLTWRLVDHPAVQYHLHCGEDGAFSASTVEDKHGARVGYLMEALGTGSGLAEVVRASVMSMRDRGAELLFAWALPGSPNYRPLLRAGFIPFPTRLRPIEINFGMRLLAEISAARPITRRDWYISYLDSDTV